MSHKPRDKKGLVPVDHLHKLPRPRQMAAEKMGSVTPSPTAEKRAVFTCGRRHQQQSIGQHNAYTNGRKTGCIYPSRSVMGGTNSRKMGSITPTPTAEKTGSICPSRSVKGGTNSSKMGIITHTPTAEKGVAFTLACERWHLQRSQYERRSRPQQQRCIEQRIRCCAHTISSTNICATAR